MNLSKPDQPDRSPVRAPEAQAGPEVIPCPPMLTLADAQVFALVARAGIPEWAIEPCMVDFVLGATGSSERRPLEVWRKWAVKHVLAMWTTPGRRPQKPEQAGPALDAAAIRKARRAAIRAYRARSEAEWMAFTEGACLPTPEQAAEFAKLGVRFRSRPNTDGAATGLDATERERPPAGVRTLWAHGASESLSGAKGNGVGH